MDLRINIARMGQITSQRNLLAGLSLVLLTVVILQIVERMSISEKIILLPPDIKGSVWVSKHEVSESFIEEWAVYMTSLLLNVSQETISYQRDLLLRNVSPESSAVIHAQFDEDKDELVKNKAATTFLPAQVEIDTGKKTATITGFLSTYVGKEKVSEHKQTYILTYILRPWGNLQLVSFAQQEKEQENG